jgi:hypothetical protein
MPCTAKTTSIADHRGQLPAQTHFEITLGSDPSRMNEPVGPVVIPVQAVRYRRPAEPGERCGRGHQLWTATKSAEAVSTADKGRSPARVRSGRGSLLAGGRIRHHHFGEGEYAQSKWSSRNCWPKPDRRVRAWRCLLLPFGWLVSSRLRPDRVCPWAGRSVVPGHGVRISGEARWRPAFPYDWRRDPDQGRSWSGSCPNARCVVFCPLAAPRMALSRPAGFFEEAT